MPGSVLLSLSYGQLTALRAQLPAVEPLLRELILYYYAFHKKRTKDLLTRSAWERYLWTYCRAIPGSSSRSQRR